MTKQQHQASDPESSVWVSANAGTGKTTVLCDRVLRLLLGGAHPSRILCITYTKAAAAEMKNRIHAQLGLWVAMADDELRAFLEQLTGGSAGSGLLKRARVLFAEVLDAPNQIRIETIHAFCQSLLRRFPLEAGVPPHFHVIDERMAGELLADATQRLYQQRAEEEPRLAAAIGYIAGRMNEGRFSLLLKSVIAERRTIVQALRSAGGLENYLAGLRIHYPLQPARREAVLPHHLGIDDSLRLQLMRCVETLSTGSATEKERCSRVQKWLDVTQPNEEAASEYMLAYLTQEGKLRDKLATNAFIEKYPELHETMQTEAQRAKNYLEALQTLELIDAAEAIMRVADALLDLYHLQKRRRSALDYDDLILLARDLLQKPGIAPWILYKLDGGLDHLLIDEAQDTSHEQWQIVVALLSDFFAGETRSDTGRTLFVVGDEKQSIYSFQNAQPKAFSGMLHHFQRSVTESGQQFRSVTLETSFRSTEAVLTAVDHIFAQENACRGLRFTAAPIHHLVHRKKAPGSVEVWPLAESLEKSETPAWQVAAREHAASPAAMLADRIAKTLDGWFREKRLLPAKEREVRPGDIMILLRSRGELMHLLIRALKRHNIPVAGADRLRVTQHIAVLDLLALGEFLLLPNDDLTLACLLKSPLFGMSEDTLFELAYDRGTLSLWQRLQNSQQPVCLAAADYLRSLLSVTDYLTPYALYARVLEVQKGRSLFVARLGEEAQDPLDEFLSLALDFSNTHPPSLQGFLHWLTQTDLEVKRDFEHGKGEVRIMTVHGAKGLQAPIVILPDTMSVGKTSAQELLWDEAGIFPFLLWPVGKAAGHARIKELQAAACEEEAEEYRRLLYVALTRAEDELIVCGYKGKREVNENHWYALVRGGLEPYAEALAFSGFGEGKFLLRLQRGENTATKSAVHSVVRKEILPLPDFARRAAPHEPMVPKPLAPSLSNDFVADPSDWQKEHARLRGTLSHRLFQLLPNVAADRREAVALEYLKRYGESLPQAIQRELTREVIDIMLQEGFKTIFSASAMAEVPITGMLQRHEDAPYVLSGQIDRLTVTDSHVLAVDFKTSRNVPLTAEETPVPYLRQLAAYRAALSEIYPNKKVKCALLWTAAPVLMPISNKLLDHHLIQLN